MVVACWVLSAFWGNERALQNQVCSNFLAVICSAVWWTACWCDQERCRTRASSGQRLVLRLSSVIDMAMQLACQRVIIHHQITMDMAKDLPGPLQALRARRALAGCIPGSVIPEAAAKNSSCQPSGSTLQTSRANWRQSARQRAGAPRGTPAFFKSCGLMMVSIRDPAWLLALWRS